MKKICFIGFLLFFSLSSFAFEREKVIVIQEKRKVLPSDFPKKLFATEEERFSFPFEIFSLKVSEEWKKLPSTNFRLLNYRFKKGETELYLSLSGGYLKDNVNRWRRQFNAEAFQNEAELFQLPIFTFLNRRGVILEMKGSYQGMGRIIKEKYALLGAIVPYEKGILTLKMVGPFSEVKKLKSSFHKALRTLSK